MIPAYLEFFGFGTSTPEELRRVARRADCRAFILDDEPIRLLESYYRLLVRAGPRLDAGAGAGGRGAVPRVCRRRVR